MNTDLFPTVGDESWEDFIKSLPPLFRVKESIAVTISDHVLLLHIYLELLLELILQIGLKTNTLDSEFKEVLTQLQETKELRQHTFVKDFIKFYKRIQKISEIIEQESIDFGVK